MLLTDCCTVALVARWYYRCVAAFINSQSVAAVALGGRVCGCTAVPNIAIPVTILSLVGHIVYAVPVAIAYTVVSE
jgi:hypothetical protein